jgi:hypothetical protein
LTFTSEEDRKNLEAFQTGDTTWEVLETLMRHLIWWHFESKKTDSYWRVIDLIDQVLQRHGITVVWDPFGEIENLGGTAVEKTPVDLEELQKIATVEITSNLPGAVGLPIQAEPATSESAKG